MIFCIGSCATIGFLFLGTTVPSTTAETRLKPKPIVVKPKVENAVRFMMVAIRGQF